MPAMDIRWVRLPYLSARDELRAGFANRCCELLRRWFDCLRFAKRPLTAHPLSAQNCEPCERRLQSSEGMFLLGQQALGRWPDFVALPASFVQRARGLLEMRGLQPEERAGRAGHQCFWRRLQRRLPQLTGAFNWAARRDERPSNGVCGWPRGSPAEEGLQVTEAERPSSARRGRERRAAAGQAGCTAGSQRGSAGSGIPGPCRPPRINRLPGPSR